MLTYIIEDDKVMGELFSRYLKGISDTKIFRDAISAINNISEDKPDLILLDILLTGPDGFTFLNEIVSYEDTAKIPVVIVSSLKLKAEKLEEYNVSRILNKETMMPEDVKKIAKEILAKSESSEGKNE
ncbi:response regulator [Candidatus Saccharibacteria bacterium]|nr:response regulator [Candidatus Saccharibacteria bacterium]